MSFLYNKPTWKGVNVHRATPVLVTGGGLAPRTNLPTDYHTRKNNTKENTMNENIGRRMINHVGTLSHMRQFGPEILLPAINLTMKHINKVLSNEVTLSEEQDGDGDMSTAGWYALLRDTRDLAAQVDEQVRALKIMHDAFTLSA